MSWTLTLAALAGAALAACRDAPAPPPREFDSGRALQYAATQVGFGPRVPGKEGHRREVAWLDSLLRARADTLIVQQWTHVTARGDSLPLTNFIARFRPSAGERILFLAHWDTRPYSDGPGSADRAAPVPGANDGASGVAVLLGIADALKRLPPAVGVDLLFVDGEDYADFGNEPNDVLIGSRYYARHPAPGAKPGYAVLFDMIGDKDLRIAPEGNSVVAAPEVMTMIWKTAKSLGYDSVFVDGQGTPLTDDHVELQKAGIRAVDVVDFNYGPGNSYWHTPNDTMDKISAASLGVIGDVALALIRINPSR